MVSRWEKSRWKRIQTAWWYRNWDDLACRWENFEGITPLFKQSKWQVNNHNHQKQESFRKTSTSALLTMPKPLTVRSTTNCGKFFKRWEYQTTWPVSWEIYMQVKKQKLEPNVQQHTGSKSGKECIKAVYCHRAYLTYMQSTSCEMPGWMKHKL